MFIWFRTQGENKRYYRMSIIRLRFLKAGDKMEREDHSPKSSVWLLGDSEPLKWREQLHTPLDSRHPIRHNIWTSVIDVVQDKVFREDRRRVDASKIYIRNAIGHPEHKPKDREIFWNEIVHKEIEEFSGLLKEYNPFIVFCFGAFAFEFARRASGNDANSYGSWRTLELGKEFRKRIIECSNNDKNIIPLLHRSIAGGRFLKSHENFVGREKDNYFEYVGEKIAKVLLAQKKNLNIWIE